MQRQIFQTTSSSRWKKFKLSARVIFLAALILLAVFIAMFVIDRIPPVPLKKDYKSAVVASMPFLQETKYSKEYSGFRHFITDKKMHSLYAEEKSAKIHKHNSFNGIRAGFYVAWDPRSYRSLKRNIHNLNLVMPEWYFIDTLSGRLKSAIDLRGLDVMKKAGVSIMPMLSNNVNREFNSKSVSLVLHDKLIQKNLIDSLADNCKRHGFAGINIDFEELNETDNEELTLFVKNISEKFHKQKLLVSQDIEPFNTDYDVEHLAEYEDYLVLMAYDEYSSSSDAGPVSSQKWIEAALDNMANRVPDEKIILGLAAFGYDWNSGSDGNRSLTYQEALAEAAESGAEINFDSDTYNLNYACTDEQGFLHRVFFTDAATSYNVMRFGSDYGIAGFGLWRLGSEDGRIWNFYSEDLSDNKVGNSDAKSFTEMPLLEGISYLGDGEVLDVMKRPQKGKIKIVMNDADKLVDEEHYLRIPTSFQIMKYGEAEDKQLLLTFDDGPDERWTPKILDILKKYHIHAAFFLVGLQAEKNLPIVKRIYDEGHLIGNHTFTHKNIAKESPDRTFTELKLTRLLIECITGHSTILFRPPYNADSEPANMEELIPVALARQKNYIDVGESIDPEDWEPGIKSDEIVKRVIRQVRLGAGHVILLHDAGGETRKETIKALPVIIEYFKKRGYTFTTVDSILGTTREKLMPNVDRGGEHYVIQTNIVSITIMYDILKFLTALFIIFIVLGICRLIFMVILTVREKISEKKRKNELDPKLVEAGLCPQVSIIVPAYNEEIDAVSSLQNLMKQDYPNFNIIFVDDGSTDGTYSEVCKALLGNKKITILTKPNGGKASALNFGIEHSDSEYLVCIDADTKLYPDAVSLLMTHFLCDTKKRIGSVAGNVKVGNRVNVLTKWQSIEYTTSQNFDRNAYAAINAITVVPGAIGAFRKCAINDAGGLTTDTLAEDCDLTIRILRAGYIIENENRAVAMTEAPEKLSQFVRQRVRWSFGIMQTFWKNRDALMVRKYKGLGIWALPNMLIFQFIIPVFSPLADLFMVIGLFSGNAGRIFIYYLIFTLVDASISIAAYFFEREKKWVLFWIIPQRLCYRWIMYVVLFKSYKKAIKGELQTWGVLKRTGNVKEISSK